MAAAVQEERERESGWERNEGSGGTVKSGETVGALPGGAAYDGALACLRKDKAVRRAKVVITTWTKTQRTKL